MLKAIFLLLTLAAIGYTISDNANKIVGTHSLKLEKQLEGV